MVGSTAGAGALLIAVLGASSPRLAAASSAADVETARALFVEGTKLANQGRWPEALELYALSLERKSAPITRYSLGVAQRETGHLAAALASFRAFLAEPSVPATAPYAEPARAAIVALEKGTGKVTITVEPPLLDGLVLAIDGEPARAGTSPPRELDPGAHEVIARAPGFRDASARFSVAAGGSAAVAITLAPSPEAAAGRWTVPVVILGLGGAMLTGGVVLGVVGVTEAGHAATRNGPEAGAARAKGIAGDVLGGVGIATVAVGLIVLLTQGRGRAPSAGAMGPSVSHTSTGIELRF